MNRALIVALAMGAVAAGHFIGQRNIDSPGDAVAAPPPELIGATLLEGLGNHDFPVTSAHAEVQRWFNQGLMLTFGFNHDAAERSFIKATQLDPDCAKASSSARRSGGGFSA